MYKVYGQNKKTGWEKIDTTSDKEKAYKTAGSISAKEYCAYMIIQNNGNGDEVIDRKDFTRECRVEYVDEVKTKIEVKAVTFKPSRMKRKQELRKLTEKYVDR